MITEPLLQAVPAWFRPAKRERALAERPADIPLRRPRYLVQPLKRYASLIPEGPAGVIDVGAGSALWRDDPRFFQAKHVTRIDVVDRFLPRLAVAHSTFDGKRIPHGAAAFDWRTSATAAHVPLECAALLAEAVRVTRGAAS